MQARTDTLARAHTSTQPNSTTRATRTAVQIANNATKAQLSLSLWGAVRESSTSSRITLVTSGGTAVLDGLHIVEPDTNFTATVEAAGFVFTSIASTGRRLLQANATNITLVGSCLNCPGATELNSGPILGSVDPATLECAPRQDWYLYMPSTPELCSDRAAACGVSLADFLAQDKKKNKCCVKHSGDSSGDRYITACAVCIPRDCQV